MKADNPIKHFVLAFIIALIGYAIFYGAIEHRRTRKGPWQIVFTNTANGLPEIVINQSTLAISNVQIVFVQRGSSNTLDSGSVTAASKPVATNGLPPGTLFDFSRPRNVPFDVPFGKCLFMDTTFLPGTLTFRLFGHEIEFMPRVMVIDHEERPWNSDRTIYLQ